MAKEVPTRVVTGENIEGFYKDMMEAAQRRRLSDADLIAVLSSTVGRMIALAPTGKDLETLRATAARNLEQGGAQVSGVVNGMRRLG